MSGGISRKIVVEPITISFLRGRENATFSRLGFSRKRASFEDELGVGGGRRDDGQVSLASMEALHGVDAAGYRELWKELHERGARRAMRDDDADPLVAVESKLVLRRGENRFEDRDLRVVALSAIARVLENELEFADELPDGYPERHLPHAEAIQRLIAGEELGTGEQAALEAAVGLDIEQIRAGLALDRT